MYKWSLLVATIICSVLFFVDRCALAQEWSVQKTAHFEVYYKNAHRSFVDEVATVAEEIYRRTTNNLGFTRYKGWLGRQKVKIYVHDDLKENVKATGVEWAGAVVSVSSRTINTFPAARGFFDSTLPHELGHIIFRDVVGPKADIPLWLEEGVATYQERGGRFGADDIVKKAISKGQFIPLQVLKDLYLRPDEDQGLVQLFYAEAASVTAYLIEEWEIYRFVRLCRELKKGRRFEWALDKSYLQFKNVSDLEEAWKRKLTNGSDR